MVYREDDYFPSNFWAAQTSQVVSQRSRRAVSAEEAIFSAILSPPRTPPIESRDSCLLAFKKLSGVADWSTAPCGNGRDPGPFRTNVIQPAHQHVVLSCRPRFLCPDSEFEKVAPFLEEIDVHWFIKHSWRRFPNLRHSLSIVSCLTSSVPVKRTSLNSETLFGRRAETIRFRLAQTTPTAGKSSEFTGQSAGMSELPFCGTVRHPAEGSARHNFWS
jgi:hypothetical protein